ncbi:unnamed protein product [Symbiodinium sp. CCMP2456]|nr:unnamed protein product [Symbiodinium sp. CCMP2456]
MEDTPMKDGASQLSQLWEANPTVRRRAAVYVMVKLPPSGRIDRACIDLNEEVLTPIIQELGARVGVDVLEEHVYSLYKLMKASLSCIFSCLVFEKAGFGLQEIDLAAPPTPAKEPLLSLAPTPRSVKGDFAEAGAGPIVPADMAPVPKASAVESEPHKGPTEKAAAPKHKRVHELPREPTEKAAPPERKRVHEPPREPSEKAAPPECKRVREPPREPTEKAAPPECKHVHEPPKEPAEKAAPPERKRVREPRTEPAEKAAYDADEPPPEPSDGGVRAHKNRMKALKVSLEAGKKRKQDDDEAGASTPLSTISTAPSSTEGSGGLVHSQANAGRFIWQFLAIPFILADNYSDDVTGSGRCHGTAYCEELNEEGWIEASPSIPSPKRTLERIIILRWFLLAGELKCSEKAMEMFKDPKGREKLRDLLAKHGDFKAVEVELEKVSTQKALNEVEGSTMIGNARRWAASKGLVRTNPVHGLEEIKIPTKESFKFSNEQLQRCRNSGTFEAEDNSGFLLSDTVGMADALTRPACMKGDVNHARVALSTVANSAKEKCLPVLQANQDVFSVLAVYIDMCGKKVDKATELSVAWLRLSTELKPKIAEMETDYRSLLQFQTDAVLDAGTPPSRKTKEDLLKCYASCTRLDLAINALMIRGRSIKLPVTAKHGGCCRGKVFGLEKEAYVSELTFLGLIEQGVSLGDNNDLISRLAGGQRSRREQEDHDLDQEAAGAILSRYFNGADSAKQASETATLMCKFGDGQLDLLYKLSAAGRGCSNTCRNLHRLIHRENMTVPVELSFVETPVRKRWPTIKKVTVAYPVIYPSSWMRYLLQEHSYLVLGGNDIQDSARWQALLSEFWQLHNAYDPKHIMNGPVTPPATHTIPLYIHGDEGRGKYKLPIMVEAVQPCISFKGVTFKNSSGHTYCTRFLYTVVPAELYWTDATLDKLHKAFAADLRDLYYNGLTVETPQGPTTFHCSVVGVKGDWVFLRKEWFNFATDAPWRSPGESPTPFKRRGSPLFTVPGLKAPERALVDPAHTWHIGPLGDSKGTC